MKREQVLCVPADTFKKQGLTLHKWGKIYDPTRDAITMFDKVCTFIEREQVENNPEYKQIVTYSAIQDKVTGKIWTYARGKGGNEDRLQSKRSIGFGGHVNAEDKAPYNGFYDGVVCARMRELKEELNFHAPYAMKFLGILNDDSDDVGRCHLGFIYKFVTETELRAQTDEIFDLKLQNLVEIKQNLDQYEAWSQMIIKTWGIEKWNTKKS